jgi:hypothetical protein
MISKKFNFVKNKYFKNKKKKKFFFLENFKKRTW